MLNNAIDKHYFSIRIAACSVAVRAVPSAASQSVHSRVLRRSPCRSACSGGVRAVPSTVPESVQFRLQCRSPGYSPAGQSLGNVACCAGLWAKMPAAPESGQSHHRLQRRSPGKVACSTGVRAKSPALPESGQSRLQHRSPGKVIFACSAGVQAKSPVAPESVESRLRGPWPLSRGGSAAHHPDTRPGISEASRGGG